MHLLSIPVPVNETRSYTGRQRSPTALTPSVIILSWCCSTFVEKIKPDYSQECNSSIKLTVPHVSSWRWPWSLLSIGFFTHRKYAFWCNRQDKLGEEKSFDPRILIVTLVCSAASVTKKSGTAKFLHQPVIIQETDGDYRFHGLGGGVGFGLLGGFF